MQKTWSFLPSRLYSTTASVALGFLQDSSDWGEPVIYPYQSLALLGASEPELCAPMCKSSSIPETPPLQMLCKINNCCCCQGYAARAGTRLKCTKVFQPGGAVQTQG